MQDLLNRGACGVQGFHPCWGFRGFVPRNFLKIHVPETCGNSNWTTLFFEKLIILYYIIQAITCKTSYVKATHVDNTGNIVLLC
jgi:hypothetical protein